MALALAAMISEFAHRFGRRPEAVARAPGRVNLIGEHTDYNEGSVLPIAIPQATWVAVAQRGDGVISAWSAARQDQQSWALHAAGAGGLEAWRPGPWPHWTSYIAGVIELLRDRGALLSGCDLYIRSEVPPGGGLASSAALCVAVAKALVALTGEPIETAELAGLCQLVEQRYAGVPCGIMDPLVCLAAQPGHALLINCRSLRCEAVPLVLPGHVFVVLDSGRRHDLAGGEYAQRREECAEAVRYFQRTRPEVRALCDVDPDALRAHASQMPPLAAARAQHVLSEQRRVLAAAAALRAGDAAAFGRLLHESHRSLRDDFEASVPEVESALAELARLAGLRGARLMGGGFGGCILALVTEEAVGALLELDQALARRRPEPSWPAFVASAGAGASIEFG